MILCNDRGKEKIRRNVVVPIEKILKENPVRSRGDEPMYTFFSRCISHRSRTRVTTDGYTKVLAFVCMHVRADSREGKRLSRDDNR